MSKIRMIRKRTTLGDKNKRTSNELLCNRHQLQPNFSYNQMFKENVFHLHIFFICKAELQS